MTTNQYASAPRRSRASLPFRFDAFLRLASAAVFLGGLSLSLGCDLAKEPQQQPKPAQPASPTPPPTTPPPTAPSTGPPTAAPRVALSPFFIELQLDAEFGAERCFARFQPGVDQLPSLLHVTTYESPSTETFPSAMLRIETNAARLDDLAGQTAAAPVAYFQVEKDGPVWKARRQEPLQVRIISVSADRVSAQIVGGRLMHSHSGQSLSPRGRFVAKRSSD